MVGGGKTPTLSQLLQEAKADSEEKGVGAKVTDEQIPLSYSRLFDEYKGTVSVWNLQYDYSASPYTIVRTCRCGTSRSSGLTF